MDTKQQELKWIESIYENCEIVGISKYIIERFSKYYLNDGKIKNE